MFYIYIYKYTSYFILFFLIFDFLSQDYKNALDLMQKMILATDLANHFKISKQLDTLASSKYIFRPFAFQVLLVLFLLTGGFFSLTNR